MLNLRRVDMSADLVALKALIARIEDFDGHPALGERKYFYLVDPPSRADPPPPGLVAEDGRGRIVAYLAMLEEGRRLWTVEAAVSPDYRRAGHLSTLLAKAGQAVRRRGGRSIRLWAYIPELTQAAEAAGFSLERELDHMRVPLPLSQRPEFPPEIAVRGFREGVDEEVWLEGNNRAFAGHPENGNWGIADLDRRRRRPWFSSEGLRMAWDGDALAGYCWTKVPSSRAGEIYVIGVLPGYQGRGLGKALLLEGIRHMYESDQARACVLYVDASNTPAVNMYRSMGFSHHHTDRSYLRQLAVNNPEKTEGTLPVEVRRDV